MSAVKWLAGFKEDDVTTARWSAASGLSAELDAVLVPDLAGRPDTFRVCVDELPGAAAAAAQGGRSASSDASRWT